MENLVNAISRYDRIHALHGKIYALFGRIYARCNTRIMLWVLYFHLAYDEHTHEFTIF